MANAVHPASTSTTVQLIARQRTLRFEAKADTYLYVAPFCIFFGRCVRSSNA